MSDHPETADTPSGEQLDPALGATAALADLEGFRLGYAWPDWWAAKVTANEAVTFNRDGRHRGGPDFAELKTSRGIVHKAFGDLVRPEDFDL